MSWIEGVGPPDLPDIFQVLSINPEALESVKQLNETLSFGNSPLGRVREEAIATVVAVANRCRFGALTASGFLRQYLGDQHTAANMLVNHHLAGLDPADRQMLDFAVQITLKPSTLTDADIENLRRVGFDDEEILSIILVTCLANFMNRLADSLGIDIPASYQKAVENWLTGPAGRQPWLMRPVSQRTRNSSDDPLPGSLEPSGWGAAPEWHQQNDGGANGFARSLFDDSSGRDSNGLDLEEAPGGELRDLDLDGAGNEVNLGGLDDLLAVAEPGANGLSGEIPGEFPEEILEETPDGVPEDDDQVEAPESGGPQDNLDSPDAIGDSESTTTEMERMEFELRFGTLPPRPAAEPNDDSEAQPPEGTTYTITTTPFDPDESERGTEVEDDSEVKLDEKTGQEETVVLVDTNNPVVRFVGDICTVKTGEVTSARDLYIAYLRWCDDNIEPPVPQRSFGMILTQMGFDRRRRGRGRNWSWWGVGLDNGQTDDDEDSEFFMDQDDGE